MSLWFQPPLLGVAALFLALSLLTRKERWGRKCWLWTTGLMQAAQFPFSIFPSVLPLGFG